MNLGKPRKTRIISSPESACLKMEKKMLALREAYACAEDRASVFQEP